MERNKSKLLIVVVVTYCVGQINLFAQHNFNFRLGITPAFWHITNYPKNYKVSENNGYYCFQKTPPYRIHGLFFNFLLEKRISPVLKLSVGINLADGVEYGYIIKTHQEMVGGPPNQKSLFSSRLYAYYTAGVVATRFPMYLVYNAWPKKSVLDVKQTNHETRILTKLDFLLGVNGIKIPTNTKDNFEDAFNSAYYSVAPLGDTMFVTEKAYHLKTWGVTILSGFELRFNRKNKELFACKMAYEYGLINMISAGVDVRINNHTVSELVYSSGSRVTISLTRSFNFTRSKKIKK